MATPAKARWCGMLDESTLLAKGKIAAGASDTVTADLKPGS